MTLRFENVTRRYGDVVALNRFDLDVGPGITALVGPNGAGKSSFMRLATGHVKPTSGTVRAFERPVWDRPDVLGRMGYVPEQDALYENHTGLEFVTDMARLHGMSLPEAKERAGAELDALGLDEARDRKIRTYSKGMRQRVKLAQALVHEPELLLLDEPMLGCDPIARNRIARRIKHLARGGRTIVLSTHILPEVAQLTRRIAVMVGGRLVARGDATAVRNALGDIPSRVRVHAMHPRRVAKDMVGWADVETVTVLDGAVDVQTRRLAPFLRSLQDKAKPTWGFRGHETRDADLESLMGYLSEGSA